MRSATKSTGIHGLWHTKSMSVLCSMDLRLDDMQGKNTEVLVVCWQTCDDEVSHECLLPSGHPVVLDDVWVVQQTEEVNLKSDEVQVRHSFVQSCLGE